MPSRPVLHARTPPAPPRPFLPDAAGWAGAVLVLGVMMAGGLASPAWAQSPAAPGVAGSGPAMKSPPSKPLWRDLSAKQQQALHPLASHWDGLSEAHKRKWLAVSRNHAQLSPAEQATLHSRMTSWAALSQQQRAQARFNFAEVKQVPADERKAKWEAYQALSPEEKRRLAEGAAPRPPGAAGTIRPVPAQKLAPVPAAAPRGQHGPRIQLEPPRSPMIAAPSISAEAQAPLPVMTRPGARSQAAASAPPAGMTEAPSSAP
jgi:hypothetical protein